MKKYVPSDSILNEEDIALHKLANKVHRDATKEFNADTQSTEKACRELTRKTMDVVNSLRKSK